MGREIVDVLDADGSGSVSTAELRDGLLLCKGQPLAKDLVDCRLKMHELQHWMHLRLEPHLQILQDMMLAIQRGSEAVNPGSSAKVARSLSSGLCQNPHSADTPQPMELAHAHLQPEQWLLQEQMQQTVAIHRENLSDFEDLSNAQVPYDSSACCSRLGPLSEAQKRFEVACE